MSDDNQLEYRIFYSWQSDLPDETNRNLIRGVLRSACTGIENKRKQENLHLIFDEATRNISGSPNVPSTIFKKIDEADIFICDISTINPESNPEQRKTPNPNVMIELGYAIATLGWNRIILLFNNAFGTLQKDMPFDISHHRATPYNYSLEKNANNQKTKNNLQGTLLEAINMIIDKQPMKASIHEEISSDQIKRDRDIEWLKIIFMYLHISTFQEYIVESPHRIHEKMIDLSERFISITRSKTFFIYDEFIYSKINNIRDNLELSTSFGHNYYPASNPRIYIFYNPLDLPLYGKKQKEWDTIADANKKLNHAIDELLDYIRKNYLEINIEELNQKGWENYIEICRSIESSFECDDLKKHSDEE